MWCLVQAVEGVADTGAYTNHAERLQCLRYTRMYIHIVYVYVYIYIFIYMGGCQNYGPFLGP